MVIIDGTGPRIPSGTVIRLLSPLGDSWDGGIRKPDAAYFLRRGVGIYACHFDEDRHSLDFYTDFDDLRVEEVRLLASVALTVGISDGLRFIYPDPGSIIVPEKIWLNQDSGQEEAWAFASEYLANPPRRPLGDPPLPIFDDLAEPGTPLDSRLQELIYDRIELSDHALLRGLATWLKSGMLWKHRSFAEEANYSLYVSLDASFSVVCRMLKAAGNLNPSAHDAAQFIEAAFGDEPTGSRYFDEFYDDRIRTMHPQSRFGTFVYAPLGRDDFYWLFRYLREVWRFLVIGQVVDPPPLLAIVK